MKTRFRVGLGIWIFLIFLLLGGRRFIDVYSFIYWLLAVLCHELGHFIAAKCCGARIDAFTLDVIGAKMKLGGELLSYNKELVIAAAGPCVNILMFLLFYTA